MDKELALRTFGYLIGHYKTHNETIINTQEIEAIEFMLKINEDLEQQCKKQKEVIDKIYELIKQHIRKDEFLELNEWQTRNLLDLLNEVSE
jgi:hypothetical protein